MEEVFLCLSCEETYPYDESHTCNENDVIDDGEDGDFDQCEQ